MHRRSKQTVFCPSSIAHPMLDGGRGSPTFLEDGDYRFWRRTICRRLRTQPIRSLLKVSRSWLGSDLEPATSGYASGVLGVLGFQWFVALGVSVILLAGLLWGWLAPRDPRGRGVALNASLVSYFSSINWLVCLVAVYLWPRFV